jgi:hypothetical protein
MLLHGIAEVASGQIQYIVKGTVADTSYRPWRQEVVDCKRYRFEIFVNGKQWRIDLYRTDLTNNITRRTVGSENGKEIVHLAVNNRGSSFVLVEPKPYPVGWNTPAFVHLWLMYASGSFLTNGTREDVTPIHEYAYYNVRPEVVPPNVQATVVLNEQEPRLPRFVVFYRGTLQDGALQRLSGKHFMAQTDFWTNAMYEAWDFKTVGKLELAGKMRFRYFLPTEGTNGNPLLVEYLCEAQVDSMDDKCPAALSTITLPARYVSTDLRVKAPPISNRVARVHGILMTNMGSSPTYNGKDFSKVPTLAQFNKYMAAGGRAGLAKEHARMARIVLGISIILPLAVLVVRTIRLTKFKAKKDQGNLERVA